MRPQTTRHKREISQMKLDDDGGGGGVGKKRREIRSHEIQKTGAKWSHCRRGHPERTKESMRQRGMSERRESREHNWQLSIEQ